MASLTQEEITAKRKEVDSLKDRYGEFDAINCDRQVHTPQLMKLYRRQIRKFSLTDIFEHGPN